MNSENATEVESDDKINMVVCYFSILFTFVWIIKSYFLSWESCETLKVNEEHYFVGSVDFGTFKSSTMWHLSDYMWVREASRGLGL